MEKGSAQFAERQGGCRKVDLIKTTENGFSSWRRQVKEKLGRDRKRPETGNNVGGKRKDVKDFTGTALETGVFLTGR